MRSVLYLPIALAILATCTQADVKIPTGVKHEKQVVVLPEDGYQWSLCLFRDKKATPDTTDVVRWLNEHQGLSMLRAQVKYFDLPATSGIYTERFQSAVPHVPALIVQDSAGRIVYKTDFATAPVTADGLYSAIYSAIQYHLKRGECPLRPTPPVTPVSPVVPGPPALPPPPAGTYLTLQTLVIITILCVLVGFAASVVTEVQSKRKQ
jgi:hypothetical protein